LRDSRAAAAALLSISTSGGFYGQFIRIGSGNACHYRRCRPRGFICLWVSPNVRIAGIAADAARGDTVVEYSHDPRRFTRPCWPEIMHVDADQRLVVDTCLARISAGIRHDIRGRVREQGFATDDGISTVATVADVQEPRRLVHSHNPIWRCQLDRTAPTARTTVEAGWAVATVTCAQAMLGYRAAGDLCADGDAAIGRGNTDAAAGTTSWAVGCLRTVSALAAGQKTRDRHITLRLDGNWDAIATECWSINTIYFPADGGSLALHSHITDTGDPLIPADHKIRHTVDARQRSRRRRPTLSQRPVVQTHHAP
jgi:hypothetical protein